MSSSISLPVSVRTLIFIVAVVLVTGVVGEEMEREGMSGRCPGNKGRSLGAGGGGVEGDVGILAYVRSMSS